MANALATRNETTSVFSSSENWSLATKMATSLAQSTIVPKDFQGNANNTLIALELANRLQTSPLMVMQNLNIIYGRPSWSAQYIIAMINGSGKYDIELQYDEKTDKNGKPFSCQCWTERHGRKVTGPVIDMDMAKAEGWVDKSGSKWKTMPQMMLRYRAASFFGRMNCPELTMGFYSQEEVIDIGPDEYRDVAVSQVEHEVGQEVKAKANTVPFEAETKANTVPLEAEVVEPVATEAAKEPEQVAPAKEEPVKQKRQSKAKAEKPTPVDIPAEEDVVDWGV